MAGSITLVARFVAAFIWAIVGFLFWIPMIVRVFFLQISLLVMAAFTNKQNSNIDGVLSSAINFYGDGFERIFSESRGSSGDYIFSWKDLENFVPTMIFTAAFYISIILFYYSLIILF